LFFIFDDFLVKNGIGEHALVEQALASLLAHVEKRHTRVGDEDVRLGAGLERLPREGDALEGEQVSGADGTEVLDDLGDAEEVLAHYFSSFLLRLGLLVVAQLLLDLLDEPLTELDIVDGLLIEVVGHPCGAQCTHELGLASQHLIGVAIHFGPFLSHCLCRVAGSPGLTEAVQKCFGRTASLGYETSASNSTNMLCKAHVSCKIESLYFKEQARNI